LTAVTSKCLAVAGMAMWILAVCPNCSPYSVVTSTCMHCSCCRGLSLCILLVVWSVNPMLLTVLLNLLIQQSLLSFTICIWKPWHYRLWNHFRRSNCCSFLTDINVTHCWIKTLVWSTDGIGSYVLMSLIPLCPCHLIQHFRSLSFSQISVLCCMQSKPFTSSHFFVSIYFTAFDIYFVFN
jgi:hypothetical protein